MPKDIIAELIKDFRDGYITIETLQNKLDFLAGEEERKQSKLQQELMRKSQILHIDEYINATTPESIVIEKETLIENCVLIDKILEDLSPYYRKIFWDWVVENKTQRQIAKELNISQQAVQSYLSRTRNKIQKVLVKNPTFLTIFIEGYFYRNKTNCIKNSQKYMFPFEYARHKGMGGKFLFNKNKYEYKTKTKCMMKKYLKDNFNYHVACTICPKCGSGK